MRSPGCLRPGGSCGGEHSLREEASQPLNFPAGSLQRLRLPSAGSMEKRQIPNFLGLLMFRKWARAVGSELRWEVVKDRAGWRRAPGMYPVPRCRAVALGVVTFVPHT